MLMECNMFAVFQIPTVYIFLCTFQTVACANIPVRFGIVALKNNVRNGKIVGIFHFHSSPFREQKVKICGEFHAVV